MQVRITDFSGKTWFLFRLRDRSKDGPGWQPTDLSTWHYNHPDDKFPKSGLAVERTTYLGDPNNPLIPEFDKTTANFITDSFKLLPSEVPTEENLLVWLKLFVKVYSDQRIYPGYFSLSQPPGLIKRLFERIERLLKEKGIKWLTIIPTWWYILKMNLQHGFEFTYQSDQEKYQKLKEALERQGFYQDKRLSSWVCVLQFWADLAEKNNSNPEELLEQLNLNSNLILRDEERKYYYISINTRKKLMDSQKNYIKKILFIGCTHGDEHLGKWLFDNYPYGQTNYCQWKVIIANPEAMYLNQRFIDEDLNRCFNRLDSNTYESKRAKILTSIIKQYDIVYDIHETSSQMKTCIFVNEINDEVKKAIESVKSIYVTLDNHPDYSGHFTTSVAKIGITLEYRRWAKDELKQDFFNIINNKIVSQEKIFMRTYKAIPQRKNILS